MPFLTVAGTFQLQPKARALNRFSSTFPRAAISLLSTIQAGNTEGVGVPNHFAEAGVTHSLLHLLRLGESFDGVGKIRVGPANAGEHSADARQNLFEVKAIEMADDSF